MKSPRSHGLVTSDAETTPEEEKHRLARDPEKVDGLQPEKRRDHEPSRSADERSSEGRKPYTTETENYGEGPAKGPTDPSQRREATVPPRR
jgi:hypothetical protein